LEKKKKLAFSTLLSSFGKEQLDLVMDAKFYGNPQLVWGQLKFSYGINNSMSNEHILMEKLHSLSKNHNETIEAYINRIQLLVIDLKSVGTIIDTKQHKFYLLKGLSASAEWSSVIMLVRTADFKNEYTLNDIYALLVNEENNRKVTQSFSTKQHETALYNNDKQKSKYNNNNNNNYHNNNNKNDKNKKQDVCRFHNTEKGCTRGDECPYKHINTCTQYSKNGMCTYGDKCKYIHKRLHNHSTDNKNKQNNTPTNNNKYNNKNKNNNYKNKHGAMNAHTHNDNDHDVDNDSDDSDEYEHVAYTGSESSGSSSTSHVEWILDGGASRHYTCNQSILYNLYILEVPETTHTANGQATFNTVGYVDIYIKNKVITLTDVAYVPEFNANLISCSALADKGATIVYEKTHALVKDHTGRIQFTIPRKGGIYMLRTHIPHTKHGYRGVMYRPSLFNNGVHIATHTHNDAPKIHNAHMNCTDIRLHPYYNNIMNSYMPPNNDNNINSSMQALYNNVNGMNTTSNNSTHTSVQSNNSNYNNSNYNNTDMNNMNDIHMHNNNNNIDNSPMHNHNDMNDINTTSHSHNNNMNDTRITSHNDTNMYNTLLDCDDNNNDTNISSSMHVSSIKHNTNNITDSNNIINIKLALKLLHEQYGHMSYGAIYKLLKNKCVDGADERLYNINMNIINDMLAQPCDGCLSGKFIRKPMTGVVKYRVTDIMDLWFTDLVGPIKESYSGYKYIQMIIDYKSRRLFVILLYNKHDGTQALINTIKKFQTQTGKVLKRLHSDGGGETVNNDLAVFLNDNGTTFSKTTRDTPQHNLIERTNRTMLDMIKCLLHHSHMPSIFWDEAALLSSHMLNIRITSADSFKTPDEILSGIKPNIKHIHVFGCDAYTYNHKKDRDDRKLGATSIKGIFVGYEKNNNSYYRIYDTVSDKIIISRDVRFYDNIHI
jgi:hypothetical protein